MCGIHLAIFSQPYLDYIIEGQKTIESRFSRNRCAPFGEVLEGDIILLKEVSGPVCGIALAKRIWFFDLEAEPLANIRGEFGSNICAGEDFWIEKSDASFATLIELANPTSIHPLTYDKRDRRGWVPLRPRQLELAF